MRSQFGGKSRIIVPLNNIPANTIGLVYTVQAYKVNENAEKILNLALSLSALMSGDVPLANVIEHANFPASTQTIEMYLIPTTRDAELFLSKQDGSWKQYFDFEKLRRMNCRVTAKWPITDTQQPYIAIKNPSSMDAIKIVVNVAAIISE